MPFTPLNSKRQVFFEGIDCPDSVEIPTGDAQAYALFAEHRWIYNKLKVAESQSVVCAPHGLMPPHFPVFSKPIYNLSGMGTHGHVISSTDDWKRHQAPGHFWMEVFRGQHLSSDVAVVDGAPRWWCHVRGVALAGGMFDYWEVLTEPCQQIEAYCGSWIAKHLPGYTGMVNLETIGGRIIEGHLRFTDQWVNLYGRDWLDAVVRLYAEGDWHYAPTIQREGYSVVLFGENAVSYAIDQTLAQDLAARYPEVLNLQITLREPPLPGSHFATPGGARLAIINCLDLDVGLEVRDRVAALFTPVQHLVATGGQQQDMSVVI